MIDYNFYNLFRAIDAIINKDDMADSKREDIAAICNDIRNELNNFFTDFKCTDMLYTVNTDKPFFGVFVKESDIGPDPILDGNAVEGSTYQVEVDSRLVTDFGLSASEIGSLMLLDIHSMSGNMYSSVLIDAIQAITVFGDNRKIVIDDNSMLALFNLSCTISARNMTSVFCKRKEELLAVENIPQFIQDCDLVESYISAINKLGARMVNTEVDSEYPAIMLNWFKSINQNYDAANGRYVRNLLRKSLSYESSVLVRRSILATINKMDSYIPAMQSQYLKSITEAKHGLISQMKRNGLRSLEDDLYEYTMRLRNVETQDDAILLMRQINSRMSILEDYLRDEPDLDDKERKRWEDCYNKYLEIRTALSKKTVYNKKMYGLFVDYNALQNMSQTGQLMNTYY